MNIKFGQLKLWQAAIFFAVIIVALVIIGSLMEKKTDKVIAAKQTPKQNTPTPTNGGGTDANGEQAPEYTKETTARGLR